MLTKRSNQKELMDLGEAYYSPEEYRVCLKKLFTINKLLGFFKNTVNLLKKLPKDLLVADIGCGGGLFLLNLSNVFPDMNLLGIDISKEAIHAAEEELQCWKMHTPNPKVQFLLHQQDEFCLKQNSVDIILLTLVCHHLTDEELIPFLQKAHQATRKALIINDLQRNAFAYWFYKITSPVLFRNRLITHDGLISIQRSFTKNELELILKEAKITNYQIKWRFPFWWSIVILK